MSRFLGGSDVGLEVPGLGIFVAPNLTPDNDTGLGNWTKDQIATAIRTGVRPDGHVLAPIMPWRAYAGLTKIDAAAIVEYLRSPPLMTQGSGSVWTGRQTGHIPNDDIAARPCQTEQLIKTTAQLSWRARKSSGRTKTTPLAKIAMLYESRCFALRFLWIVERNFCELGLADV
jgi:hypothetical protein